MPHQPPRTHPAPRAARTNRRTRSITVAAALAVAALAGAAGAASASTVSIEGNTLVLRAQPGERNDLTILRDRGGDVAVRQEGGRPERRGDGCRDDPNAPAVLCLRFRVGQVRLELGDGDDRVRVEDGLPVAVIAGPGDDRFSATDVRVDPVFDVRPAPSRVDFAGGPGRDTASFDAVFDERSLQPGVTVTNDDRPGDGRPIDANNVRSDVEVLVGSPQDDVLTGGPAADIFISSRGADTLTGGAGDDEFLMGTVRDGPTRVVAGGGRDTVSYAQRTRPVFVSPDDPAFRDGESGEFDDIAGADVVEGGAAADNLVTAPRTPVPYRLVGGPGDDVISSGDGRDRLIGGPGADALASGGGRDVIEARDGAHDRIDCGTNGEDRVEVDRIEQQVRGCEDVDAPFPFLGVPRLTPRTVDARAGRPVVLTLGWAHPTGWRKLDSITLTLAARGRTVGRLVVDPETRRVRAHGDVTLVPGGARVRERGARRVAVRLAVRIARRHAGGTLLARLGARGDDGAVQPPRRVGAVRVTR